MLVADVVERRAQRLHGAVDRRVRHQLFQQAPLLVLAGAARCGRDAPLIAYLSDMRLIEVVKECLSTENAFDPGEFASRRLLVSRRVIFASENKSYRRLIDGILRGHVAGCVRFGILRARWESFVKLARISEFGPTRVAPHLGLVPPQRTADPGACAHLSWRPRARVNAL
jgi:hypothetical protein